MVVKSKGIPPEMSETFRFRNYSHSNVPKYYPPKKTDMSREQLWHWKMISSFWNGPFFGEMRLFSRGITPANLSSNDPLVRLKTSTPSKTHMTIEKQPWVEMYLLWKKTADFPAIAMSVNLRDIPTSPADCTKVGPTPIPGSWPLLLGQKNGDPKGMNLDGNFSGVSCKFLGVYHLRWIYVTWVCVWLFFFVCVCTPWKMIGLNPTKEQQWRFGSIAWFLDSILICRSVTLIDLPKQSYQQHVSQIHLLSGQRATEMIWKSRGFWYSYWVGPLGHSLPPIAHARKQWK